MQGALPWPCSNLNMSYRPLPECLTIKESEVHGLGIFAIEPIPKDTCLGQSHLRFNKEIYRTPLGGFINHSDSPNCIKETSSIKPNGIEYVLKANKDIGVGEELTVFYTFYKI